MITKRLLGLQAFLLCGLGSVFLLPKSVGVEPAGIALSLPEYVSEWYGRDQAITQGEIESLGPDTEFARKLYTNARGDQLFVSIVLSGPDMNTSIHRPERCLPAQGWTVTDTKALTIPTPAGPLEATRLHNVRSVRADSGASVTVYNLNYYWFIGSRENTASHIQRTLIDIRDRVLRGANQRWAYITVAANVTQGLTKFGRSEQETDEIMQRFVAEMVPQLQTGTHKLAARSE
jgi:EpsI family protein